MNAVDSLSLAPRSHYDGLDLLSTAVLLVDGAGRIAHVNQSAELLFDTSRKTLIGQLAGRVLGGNDIHERPPDVGPEATGRSGGWRWDFRRHQR